MKKNNITANFNIIKPIRLFFRNTFGIICGVIAIITFIIYLYEDNFFNIIKKDFIIEIRFLIILSLVIIIIMFILLEIVFFNIRKFYNGYIRVKQLEINNENRIIKIEDLKSENELIKNQLGFFIYLFQLTFSNVLSYKNNQGA